MGKARQHSKTILDCLPSRQSALQMYKFCASHKMTHLFGADILTNEDYPRNWNTWDSDMCSDFNGTTSHLLASLTSNKQRGLGIQHPRITAIPPYFLTMRRNIQYVIEGIWASNHTPAITLPGHLRSL